MRPPIEFFVVGEPKGQPRARAFARGGMVRMYDPGTAEGWKSAIADEWRRSVADKTPFVGPVSVSVKFYFPRPKSHYNKHGLRPNMPVYVTKKPDRDNLDKAVLDALTQIGVWHDDAQVCDGRITKTFTAWNQTAGCLITIAELDDILHDPTQP